MSANGGLSPSPIAPPKTSFARLDPSFLYQGQAKDVAEQFEKRTGMKREAFIQEFPPSPFRESLQYKMGAIPAKKVSKFLEKALLSKLPAWIDFAAVFAAKKSPDSATQNLPEPRFLDSKVSPSSVFQSSSKPAGKIETGKKELPPDPLLTAMVEASREAQVASNEESLFNRVSRRYRDLQSRKKLAPLK